MTERPQPPALTDPSPNRHNSHLRLVIGEAPMPQTDYELEAWSRSPREESNRGHPFERCSRAGVVPQLGTLRTRFGAVGGKSLAVEDSMTIRPLRPLIRGGAKSRPEFWGSA